MDNSIFDVSKALDTVQARQTTAAEKHRQKAQLTGKRAEVRHTRPEQLNFKTTLEVRQALARLAKVMNKSRVEVMEIAILSLEDAVAPKKGKRS